jgi:hypothetical protein
MNDAERARQAEPVGLREAAIAAINDHADIRLPDGRLAIARDVAVLLLASPPAQVIEPGPLDVPDGTREFVAFAVEYLALHMGEDHATVRVGRRIVDTLESAAQAVEPSQREALVVEMENEGVVTWGDDGHRARFIDNA